MTHDPDENFETTLVSLQQQEYANLAVLVLDNHSAEPVEGRVKALMPEAHVVRLAANRGYGAAANRAPAVVNGASFYLFCHDDVYLEPDAVSGLVTEAFRSNAGIVGPKFVDWDEPEMLLDLGKAIDKFAFPAPVAEPGELDQAQHDAVRDTFAVNGAAMLVRADLFEAVDGFPSDFSAYEEDTDLCWRAHLAGARVVVTPTAVVRHREATLRAVPPEERLRSEYAHRARMVLTNYSGAHLLRVLPQAVLFSLGDFILNLLAFRPAKAADVALAWTWNLAHLRRSLGIRSKVKAFRRAPDSEIRNYQVGGSARVTAFVRGTVGESAARINSGARQSRTVVQRLREGPSQVAALSALLVGLVLLIGSRGVILGDIPVVREFSDTTASWSSMLREYWDGWRTTGLGGGGATPTLVGAMGVLSTALFGGEGLVRNLLIVGCLPAGVIGAWWMARGGSSSKTRALMMVAYAITPVPYNAIAEGRWGALGLWAGLPWMVGLLGRAAGAMPFAGSEFRTLSGLRATVALGMVTAAVTTVLPVAPIVIVVLALLMAAVGLVDRSDLARWERAVPTAVGAAVVAFALHLPWAIGLLVPWPHWSQIIGPPSTAGGPVALRDLVWLDTGVNSFGVVLVGLHLAAAFAVLVGREWRFRLAVQGWSIALVGWVLAWLGEARLGPTMPPPEVLLMLPVLGLSVAIGAGLAAFERDVAGSDFGFRQVFSMMAATLMVVASVAWVARSINGRWGLPDEDNLAVVGTLESQAPEGGFRTLWLGDPDVLPLGSWPLSNGTSYATTQGLFPRAGDWFEGPRSAGTAALEEALEDAVAGKTTRLGRLLGPMGVKFVVVARSGAPLAYDTGKAVVEPPASTVNALDEQLDLARLSVSESLFIYDNSAFAPEVAQLPAGTLDDAGDDLAAMLSADLGAAEAVLPEGRRFAEGVGELDPDAELYVARTRDANWTLTVDGREVDQEAAFGWATRADTGDGGAATLAYSPPPIRSLAVILQFLALLASINVVRRRRDRTTESVGFRRSLAERRKRVAERRERREQSPELSGPLLPTSELPKLTVEGDDAGYGLE
ncbi:MAG: glycosyltransferase, partial [Microthrixaceae bacterium]|nr:glycosyltransferase [Microthrixaceae bacterium]